MSKRLAMLEKLTTSGQADSFAWYALALEYRSEKQPDEAVQTFATLRDRDPAYVPMYLMAGQVLFEANRLAEARGWVEAGQSQAGAKGDLHAAGELEALLEQIVSALDAAKEVRLRAAPSIDEVSDSAWFTNRLGKQKANGASAGFHPSCEQVVLVDPRAFKLSPGLTVTNNSGLTKPFDQKAFAAVLAGATHRGDRVRLPASAWLPGHLLDPFRYEKTHRIC